MNMTLERIKCHLDNRYSRYNRKSDWANEKKWDCSASTSNSAEDEEQGQKTCRSSKRLRFDEKVALNCIEWVNNTVKQPVISLFFKDDVQIRYIFWKTIGDEFATDINCLRGYILKFKREVELIMRDINYIEDECTKTVTKGALMSMDFTSRAQHLSDLQEEREHTLWVCRLYCS